MYVHVICSCVFEDGILSFYKHGVVFLQKNLKSINPTSQNQVFDCFSAQKDFHNAPFATSGGIQTSERS